MAKQLSIKLLFSEEDINIAYNILKKEVIITSEPIEDFTSGPEISVNISTIAPLQSEDICAALMASMVTVKAEKS